MFNWVPENPTHNVRYYAKEDIEEVKINEIRETESISFSSSVMEGSQLIIEENHENNRDPLYFLEANQSLNQMISGNIDLQINRKFNSSVYGLVPQKHGEYISV